MRGTVNQEIFIPFNFVDLHGFKFLDWELMYNNIFKFQIFFIFFWIATKLHDSENFLNYGTLLTQVKDRASFM